MVITLISLLPLAVLVRAKSTGLVTNPPTQSNSVPSFGGNAQHTSVYQPAAQTLNQIRWTTTIDLNPGDLAHYGSPLVTAANTVFVPVKTATDGFRVDVFDGNTNGVLKYTLTTDYVLPSHSWVPVYNPCLTTGPFGTRLYYAGRGGTLYYIDDPDSVAHGTPVHEVFYTTLANYLANAAAYNASIFINTPFTADSKGNVFFGFRVSGTAPAPISSSQSGFARIDPNGNGTYILAGAASNDGGINRDSHNSAPALSNDESLVYVMAKNSMTGHGYLLALDSTTLAPRHRVFVQDPRNDNPAVISDDSTASPMVAPDGDVYIGVLSNPGNGSRGFLLRFSGDLSVEKTPGAFGWDYTAAIVPSSMVPSYQGTSTYLIFSKYNNYAGFGDGDGVNRIALLDPNDTQTDPHPSAPGLLEMREVMTVTGPTPDENSLSFEFPYAVREWCINTAAVNPATNSIFTPSEDGYIYRWNLVTNSLSQAVQLTEGIGEPYVPTIIGPDGIVYTLNGGTLFALGKLEGVDIALTSSMPDVRPVVVGEPITFTATVTNTGPGGTIPTGTITFKDFTYQDLIPITTTLGTVTLDGNGQASLTTSSLTAGNGFLGNHHITAMYSGDSMFTHGDAVLVQKIHASATTTTLNSSPNPSNFGQLVVFTATVADTPPSSLVPSGMITFHEGATVLAQIPLNGSGAAAFATTSLFAGNHVVTATYSSDTVFASSSGDTTQVVVGGPTPTPSPGITPTPTIAPTPTPTSTATPTPTPPGAAQPVNLSTRMLVQTGDNVGIGGFIITGTAPKRLLLRGIGPSLTGSGVPNAMADPVLELHGPSGFATIINNNWRDTQEAEIQATGLAPTNDLECAIVVTLNPGAYTGIVRGSNNSSGVALIEVYDISQTVDSKLANISTRALVGTGSDILIAGFILGAHTDDDRIVVRGIGPSLTTFGVPDALADPTLELRDSNGALILANNDWQDDPAQAAELTAAGLAPTSNLESGIATTLAPGTYTALLAGMNSGTGVGLVEVYDRGAP